MFGKIRRRRQVLRDFEHRLELERQATRLAIERAKTNGRDRVRRSDVEQARHDLGLTEDAVVDSITCPRCGRTSYHPDDVREGYCGACHDWTSRGARHA